VRSRKLAVVSPLGLALLFFIFVYPGKGYFTTKAYPVFRQLEEGRLSRYTRNYESLEDGQVRVFYLEKDRPFAFDVLDLVRRDLAELERFFDSSIEELDIVLYSSEELMFADLGIKEGSKVMGAYYGGRVNVLTPRLWATDGDGNGLDVGQLANTVLHEITHLMVEEMARGNFPLWFTEGMALYMEYAVLGYEWAADMPRMVPYSAQELENSFSRLDQNLAYKQSFLLVKHLHEQVGREGIREMLGRLRKGENFDQVLEEISGQNLETMIHVVQFNGISPN
jgi:hypothetical protein